MDWSSIVAIVKTAIGHAASGFVAAFAGSVATSLSTATSWQNAIAFAGIWAFIGAGKAFFSELEASMPTAPGAAAKDIRINGSRLMIDYLF